MLDIEEIKSKIQDFDSRNDEIKDIEKDIEEANTVLRNDRREFETEFADIIAGASTNPIKNEQKNREEAELKSREDELLEIRGEITNQKAQLTTEFNDFRLELLKNVQREKDKLNEQFERYRNSENAEQFGMTQGERVERLESLRKEKEHIESIIKERDQLITDSAIYRNRIDEWENNNIDPNDAIYKRLKEEVLPRTDSRISEIDQELEKVKGRDIDKEIADESEILEFNPETYSAQYDSLEKYENKIKDINVYSMDSQLESLRNLFEVKSQEELRQEEAIENLKGLGREDLTGDKIETEHSPEGTSSQGIEDTPSETAEGKEKRINEIRKARDEATKAFPEAIRYIISVLRDENNVNNIIQPNDLRENLGLTSELVANRLFDLLSHKAIIINNQVALTEKEAITKLKEIGREDLLKDIVAEGQNSEGHSSQGIEDTPSETVEGQETEGQENSSASKKIPERSRENLKAIEEAKEAYPKAIRYIISVLRDENNVNNIIQPNDLRENLGLTNELAATKLFNMLSYRAIIINNQVVLSEEEAITKLKELGRDDLLKDIVAEGQNSEGHSSQGIEDTPSETAEGQENEGQENSSASKEHTEIAEKIAEARKEAEDNYPNAIGYIIGVLRNKENKYNRILSSELTKNLNLTNPLVATKIKQKLENDGILRADRVCITEEEAINKLKELGREDLIPKEMKKSTDKEHQTQGNSIQIDDNMLTKWLLERIANKDLQYSFISETIIDSETQEYIHGRNDKEKLDYAIADKLSGLGILMFTGGKPAVGINGNNAVEHRFKINYEKVKKFLEAQRGTNISNEDYERIVSEIDEFNNELNRTRQKSAVQGQNEGEHVEGEKAESDKVQEQPEKQGKYEELVDVAINKLADCLKAGKAKFNVDEEFKEMNLDKSIRFKIYEKLVQMGVIDELEFINEEQTKKVLEIKEQRSKISSILSGKGFKINIGKTGIIERESMKRIAPDVDMKRGAYLNYEYYKDNNSDDDIRGLAENYYLKDISNLITKCHANNVPIDFTIIESIRSKNIIIEEKEKDALIKAYLTNMLISHYKKTQAKDLEEYKDAKKFDELEITYDMKDLSKPIPLHKALLICMPFIGNKFLKKDLSASDKIRIVNLAEKAKEYNVGKIKGSYKYNDNSLSAKILRLFKHDTKLLPAPPVPETRNKTLSQQLKEDYPISSSNRGLETEEPSKGEVDRGVDKENIVDSEKE